MIPDSNFITSLLNVVELFTTMPIGISARLAKEPVLNKTLSVIKDLIHPTFCYKLP